MTYKIKKTTWNTWYIWNEYFLIFGQCHTIAVYIDHFLNFIENIISWSSAEGHSNIPVFCNKAISLKYLQFEQRFGAMISSAINNEWHVQFIFNLIYYDRHEIITYVLWVIITLILCFNCRYNVIVPSELIKCGLSENFVENSHFINYLGTMT